MRSSLFALVGLLVIVSPAIAQDDQATTNPANVKTTLGDSPAILKTEFVFETAPFPSCHASTIAQTKTGLVAAWFGGTRERAPDVGIWVSRHDDSGWSKPVEVANGIQPTGPRLPTWNPALYQSPNGPLVLFYKVGPSPSTWWGMRMTSDDGGATWSKPTRLPDGFLGPIKDKPILLSDGTLLCPSSVEGSATTIHMEFTPDLGLTWTKTEPLSDSKIAKLIQPTVLDHGQGVLEYLCRTKGNIYEGWSQDNGKTWSAPAATTLPCPGSGLDAMQLKDGRSLLAYDNSPDARHPLCVAISPDGKSWGKPILIEDTDGPQLSYPAVIQTDDGLVHLTYTWLRKRIRHAVLDPSKLQQIQMQTTSPMPLESETTAPAAGGYRWWVVFMLWFICFFNYADRQAISAVFPKLSDEFGFDTVQLGLIGSAFMWVYAFGAPFAGFIADRAKRKNLILGGCFFWSLVTITTSWCKTLRQFITVRALEGFGETFYFPASMSLVSDYHGPQTRSKALAFHQSSVYVGTILGSWIAALLAERGGWRDGFYLFGSCGVVLVIVLALFLREPPREVNAKPAQVQSDTSGWESLLKPSAVLLMLAFLCANFVATIFLIWTPTFLVRKFDFKLAAAGLSGSLFIHLASAFGAPLGGILADNLRRHTAGGRMIVQAAGLLLGCGFLFLVGTTTSRTTLLLSMTVFGFGKGLYDSNIFASLYDVVEPRARATAAGVMNTVGWGGGALGPLAVGWFSKHGQYKSEIDNMSHAIAATSVIYAVSAALLILVALVFIRHDQIDATPDSLRTSP